MEEEKDHFEEVMETVGYGWFQKRFNYMFNLTFAGLITAPYFNFVLALAIPEHWCHVPGREDGNFTMEDWKNMTIPWKKHENEYSKCTMYNSTSTSVDDLQNRTQVKCQNGWDYNNTWFKSTITSDENWYCDGELYISYAFTLSSVGELLGTVVFGYLGDRIGRRPVFLISTAALLFGRIVCLYTTKMYTLFLTTIFIGSFASFSIFQSPLIIAMEMTREDDRATVAFLQSMGYNTVFCVMPLIFWYLGNWYPFMLATTLPVLGVFIFQGYLTESPRWLASRGRDEECIKILKQISEVNGRELPEEVPKLLAKSKLNPDKAKRMKESILSSWILIKTTVYVCITWIATNILYSIFFLNASNIGGNPFMNYFWQALAEVPGNIIAKYLCDIIGRRLTRFISFLMVTAGSIVTIFLITDSQYVTAVSVVSAFVKFSASIIFYALGLHTLEIYPTALRQTGLSIATISSGIISMCSPYIIYFGTSYDSRIPYIFCTCLGISGALAVLPIPETLHQNLPATIKEAEELGKGQSFWKIPKKIEHDVQLTEIKKQKNSNAH